MKIYILFLLALEWGFCLHAQSGNPQSKAEVEARQKQAQQALDALSPEQRKMMEQMGIKIPDGKPGTGMTDGQVSMAVGGVSGGVPRKNEALIAAIPKVKLDLVTLPGYIKKVGDYVGAHLSADSKAMGQKAYGLLMENGYSQAEMANVAAGLWAVGKLEPAVYVMTKVCGGVGTPDGDMLCNYSAMLSMAGAPQQAIPILEYLNQAYPDNTTVLNNLGQAWFYLGDIEKADMYLEKTVRLFAYHPQANYTQCLILESKGNKAAAIEKMKHSLAYSYSLDKYNKLRQLGYKVKGSEMRRPFRPDPDPLGLRRFTRPDFPKTYSEEVRLKYEWNNFEKLIADQMLVLNKQLQPYIMQNAQKAQQTYTIISAKGVSGLSATPAGPRRVYQKIATQNLEDMNKDGGLGYRLGAAKKKIEELVKSFQAEKDQARQRLIKANSVKAEQETELAKKGEDLGYDVCKVQVEFSDWVYKNYNRSLEEAYKDYLHQYYLKISEELYWKQFIQDDNEFEVTKLTAKKEWLAAVGGGRYLESAYITENNVCNTDLPDKNKTHKLGDFDEMHCKFSSTLDFGFGRQVFSCNSAYVDFSAGKLSGKLNFKTDNTGVDRFTNGTVEVTAIDVGAKKGMGPLQVGANMKAGMGMEFSRNGVEDVYVTGEASVTVGSNTVSDPSGVVSNPSVDITASGRISLVSGNMSGGIKGF
ncbi:MAG: hypothetical protein JST68_30530 [Bacteroidetes bacterium]|nr:hypothetical protein [Bacteroidota bacterium]